MQVCRGPRAGVLPTPARGRLLVLGAAACPGPVQLRRVCLGVPADGRQGGNGGRGRAGGAGERGRVGASFIYILIMFFFFSPPPSTFSFFARFVGPGVIPIDTGVLLFCFILLCSLFPTNSLLPRPARLPALRGCGRSRTLILCCARASPTPLVTKKFRPPARANNHWGNLDPREPRNMVPEAPGTPRDMRAAARRRLVYTAARWLCLGTGPRRRRATRSDPQPRWCGRERPRTCLLPEKKMGVSHLRIQNSRQSKSTQMHGIGRFSTVGPRGIWGGPAQPTYYGNSLLRAQLKQKIN
jgi:hypothetical protein